MRDAQKQLLFNGSPTFCFASFSPLYGKFNIFWLHPPVAYFVAYLHSTFKMQFALYIPRPIFPHDKSCLFVFESSAYPLTLKI